MLNFANGLMIGPRSPLMVGRNRSRRRVHLSLTFGFDAASRPRRGMSKIRSALFAHRHHGPPLLFATDPVISLVAGVADRTGSAGRDVNNRSAHRVAFLRSGLNVASHIITVRLPLPGLPAHAGYVARPDATFSMRWQWTAAAQGNFFASVHKKFRTPYKNTILVGLPLPSWQHFPERRYRKRWSTSARCWPFIMVCTAGLSLRRTNPRSRGPSARPGARGYRFRIIFKAT